MTMPYKDPQRAKEYHDRWRKKNKKRLSELAKKRGCTPEAKKKRREYYLAHREEKIAKVHAYREKHRQKHRNCSMRYHRKHREENILKMRARYAKNKRAIRAAIKLRYRIDPEYRKKAILSARRTRKKNPEGSRAAAKKYRESHKDELQAKKRVYRKRRMETNPCFKLAVRLRGRINAALRRYEKRGFTVAKRGQKVGSAIHDMGCTLPILRAHIESLFQPGMTWENWSPTGWHIDHIRPLASFDLTKRRQFLKACHYTNLQPLWATDNLHKSSKVVK